MKNEMKSEIAYLCFKCRFLKLPQGITPKICRSCVCVLINKRLKTVFTFCVFGACLRTLAVIHVQIFFSPGSISINENRWYRARPLALKILQLSTIGCACVTTWVGDRYVLGLILRPPWDFSGVKILPDAKNKSPSDEPLNRDPPCVH